MASFTDLDTLRQMGLVSLIYNGNHQLCLKFSCAGTGITFTGSMDSVLIIAAIKQQMTVDNIGLHGIIGPMGGMMTEYVPLPTVSTSYTYPNQLWNYSVNIGAGSSTVLRDQNGNALSYDSTKSYAALNYYTSTSDSAGTIDTNISIGASGSFLALFNNGSSQITVQRVNVATCDSTATIITVYDSSNNPYNAFKYTSDGTDYYYVLDGTQTDWTDDLASIGYHLGYIDIIAGIRWDPSTQTWLSKTFSGSSDWWWCGVINQSDVSRLNNFGVGVITKSDTSSQWNGTIGAVAYNPDFDYTIEGFYSDFGETPVAYNLNDFFIARKSTTSSGNYDLSCLIHSVYATGEPVKSYRLRIRPGGNRNSCLFTTYSGSFVADQWYPLYKVDGSAIVYTGVPTSVIGYFDFNTSGYDAISLIPSGYTISFRNNNGFLEFKQSNQLSQSLNSVYALIVIWSA